MITLSAADVMSAPVETVTASTTLRTVAERMTETGVGSVVVTNEADEPTGIVTRTDLVAAIAADDVSTSDPISRYVGGSLETVRRDTDLQDVAARMREAGIKHLPVVDEAGVLVGMVTTSDLLGYVSRAAIPRDGPPGED
ncbi:MAG: CBS domain-containing protein [Halodesulfurarchaeum sp.]